MLRIISFIIVFLSLTVNSFASDETMYCALGMNQAVGKHLEEAGGILQKLMIINDQYIILSIPGEEAASADIKAKVLMDDTLIGKAEVYDIGNGNHIEVARGGSSHFRGKQGFDVLFSFSKGSSMTLWSCAHPW